MTMTAPELRDPEGTHAEPTLARTFRAMMVRDVRVMRHQVISSLIRVLTQPLLFVFVFAYVLPKIGGAAGLFQASSGGGRTFTTILVPGLVGSAMVMQAINAVVFPLMMELSWQRSIQDRALAPLPVQMIAVQKIVGGGLQGLIGGLIVFPAVLFVHADGQEPHLDVSSWPLLILAMVTGSLMAASVGLFLGTVIDPQQGQMLFTLVMIPATMLGCVYFPWSALEHVRWLQILVLFNPLVYVNEALRASLTPAVGHLPTWSFLLVLIGGTVLFAWLASRTFTRRVLT